MKSNLTKVIGASVFALSMTMLPLTLPAQAQSNGGTSNTTTDGTTTTAPSTTTRTDERNDFDWGWLGLTGLLGLAGLAGKNRREDTTRYRDPNAVGTSTYKE
ncbi:WGxxGxxG family protein [Tolypothrix sp. NIES-4075]|uniref:WGxxGxxG family protein n=1 Tax=Tolypothrix sp. NIES-4075 TaxID=2005459 RepID=UPI000B5C2F04|nr:WGxxGxxG family protein [Tolypothrix sp. NIES-4075]